MRVPVYSRQVQSQPVPGVMLDAGQFTPQAAGQAGQALLASSDVAERISLRQDSAKAFSVETAVKANFNEFEQQLRQSKRGLGAEGYADEVTKWWAQAEQASAAELNPRARQLAQRSLTAAREQSIAGALRYQVAEMDRAQLEAYAASQGVEIQRAITNGTPAGYEVARQLLMRRVEEQGVIRGWSPEQRQAEALKYTTQLHGQVVQSLMNGEDPLAAMAYFNEHRAEIDSSQHVRMQQVIENAQYDVQGRQLADSVAVLPFAEQLQKVAEIDDPKLRDRARAHVRQNQADLAAARAEQQRVASDQVWQLISNGTPRGQLPQSVLAEMNGRDRLAVENHYRAEAERRRKEALGEPIRTDWSVYEKLWLMEPEELKNEQLSQYRDQLSDSHYAGLVQHQRKLREPDGSRDVATMTQNIGTYIDELELTGSKNAQARGQLRAQAFTAFDEFVAQHKRQPNMVEQREILDHIVSNVEVRRTIMGIPLGRTEVPRYQAERDPAVRARIPVSSDELKAARAELEAAGHPLARGTDDEVRDLVRRYKIQQGSQ